MADKGPSALTHGTAVGAMKFHVIIGGNSRYVTADEILAILHAHAISDVTGLQAALDAKLDDSQAGAGGLAVLLAANAAAVRAAAGLVIGTDVQAYDADLATYAGITPSANVQSVLGAADYTAIRTLLGLVIGTNVQAYDADLTTYASITPSANVQSLLGAANYAAMKTLLSLTVGTDIPARNPSIQAVTSSATVTPTFADDQVNITAQAAGLTLANPTGTAVDGWGIAIRIKDNGTARSLTFGTQYRAIGVTLPTTTVISKTLYLGMVFNNADTKWDVVAVAQEA